MWVVLWALFWAKDTKLLAFSLWSKWAAHVILRQNRDACWLCTRRTHSVRSAEPPLALLCLLWMKACKEGQLPTWPSLTTTTKCQLWRKRFITNKTLLSCVYPPMSPPRYLAILVGEKPCVRLACASNYKVYVPGALYCRELIVWIEFSRSIFVERVLRSRIPFLRYWHCILWFLERYIPNSYSNEDWMEYGKAEGFQDDPLARAWKLCKLLFHLQEECSEWICGQHVSTSARILFWFP